MPQRTDIAATNLELMEEALEALGLDVRCARDAYEALADLIQRRSRSGRRLSAAYVANIDRLRNDIQTKELVSQRSVARYEVIATIQDACVGTDPVLQAPDDVPETRLTEKLRLGGLEETAINAARRLRAAWYAFERQYRDDLSRRPDEIDDLRLRTLDLAADATTEVAGRHPEPYAPALRSQMKETVRVRQLEHAPVLPVDDALLMGLVYQLTDECEIWWSSVPGGGTNGQ